MIAMMRYENTFEIAFIPHTVENTIVQHYRAGQLINMEVDMIGKYLQRFIKTKEVAHV